MMIGDGGGDGVGDGDGDGDGDDGHGWNGCLWVVQCGTKSLTKRVMV